MADVELLEPHKTIYEKLSLPQREAAREFELLAAESRRRVEVGVAKTNASMLRWSLITALVFCLIFVGIVYFAEKPALILFVVLTGILGALLSNLIRFYSNENPPEFIGLRGNDKWDYADVATFAMVPPVVGAISACVMYALFAGGFLTGGAFFPTFACAQVGDINSSSCSGFYSFLSDWLPAKPADGARLLIWCLLAGFAEKLVPDKLKGLVGSFPGK
jgi:hypothetical protein